MKFFDALVLIIMIICFILLFWMFIEMFNSDYINTNNKVPCLDARHRQFENELCYEKISCTNLPFSFSETTQCKDVKGGKDD